MSEEGNKTHATAQIDFSHFYKVEKEISRIERQVIQDPGKLSGNRVNFSQKDEQIFWFICVTYLKDRQFLICSFSFNPFPNLPCGPTFTSCVWLDVENAWGYYYIILLKAIIFIYCVIMSTYHKDSSKQLPQTESFQHYNSNIKLRLQVIVIVIWVGNNEH